MAIPLDIPWVGGLWADQPGFSAPADGAASPLPTDLDGNAVSQNQVFWSTTIGGKSKPSWNFTTDESRFTITPAYVNPTFFTAVIVGQITSPLGADLLDGAGGQRHLIDSDGATWRTFSGALVSGGTADEDMHLFILEHNTDTGIAALEVDEVQVFSSNAGTDARGTVHIGSSDNGAHFGSKIAFAGILDRALTIQEKDDLWAWYQSEYVIGTTVSSKRDALLASLPGTGSVSDRLHAQQEAAYVGTDPTEPLTLNDYLVANGEDKNIIQ